MASDEPNWLLRRKELANELVNYASGTSSFHGDFQNKTLYDNVFTPIMKYGLYIDCKVFKRKVRIAVEYQNNEWIPQKCTKCKLANRTCIIINSCIGKKRRLRYCVDKRLNSEKKKWKKQQKKSQLTPSYRYEPLQKTSIMSSITNGIKSPQSETNDESITKLISYAANRRNDMSVFTPTFCIDLIACIDRNINKRSSVDLILKLVHKLQDLDKELQTELSKCYTFNGLIKIMEKISR
eukprot:425638_1